MKKISNLINQDVHKAFEIKYRLLYISLLQAVEDKKIELFGSKIHADVNAIIDLVKVNAPDEEVLKSLKVLFERNNQAYQSLYNDAAQYVDSLNRELQGKFHTSKPAPSSQPIVKGSSSQSAASSRSYPSQDEPERSKQLQEKISKLINQDVHKAFEMKYRLLYISLLQAVEDKKIELFGSKIHADVNAIIELVKVDAPDEEVLKSLKALFEHNNQAYRSLDVDIVEYGKSQYRGLQGRFLTSKPTFFNRPVIKAEPAMVVATLFDKVSKCVETDSRSLSSNPALIQVLTDASEHLKSSPVFAGTMFREAFDNIPAGAAPDDGQLIRHFFINVVADVIEPELRRMKISERWSELCLKPEYQVALKSFSSPTWDILVAYGASGLNFEKDSPSHSSSSSRP